MVGPMGSSIDLVPGNAARGVLLRDEASRRRVDPAVADVDENRAGAGIDGGLALRHDGAALAVGNRKRRSSRRLDGRDGG